MFIDQRKNLHEEFKPTEIPYGPDGLPYPPPNGPPPFANPNNLPDLVNPNSPPDPGGLVPPAPYGTPPTSPFSDPGDMRPSKRTPYAPRGPIRSEPPMGLPPDAVPDYNPANLHQLPEEWRWAVYYDEWANYLSRQKVLILQDLDLFENRRTTLLLCNRPECLMELQNIEARIDALMAQLQETEDYLKRVSTLTKIWWRRWFNLLDPNTRMRYLAKGKKYLKALKKFRDALKRRARRRRGDFRDLFSKDSIDSLDGGDIMALAMRVFGTPMSGEQVSDDFSVKLLLEVLGDLFPEGKTFTFDEIMEIIREGMIPMEGGRGRSGQTSRGTFSAGGAFGSTQLPQLPTEPPPEEPPTGGGGEPRPEGEMARMFAKFNKSRMGRGMR